MKITSKIRDFLSYYIESFNPAIAAEKVGYSPRYGYEILKNLNSQYDFIALMDECGVTNLDIVMGLKEAKLATQPNWNPETKTFQQFPDYRVRLKATELIARLKGYLQVQTLHSLEDPLNPCTPEEDEAFNEEMRKGAEIQRLLDEHKARESNKMNP